MSRLLGLSLAFIALSTAACSDGAADGLALKWVWDEGEVMAMPVVADLDGDGTSDVVAVLGRAGADASDDHAGALVALDGSTGAVRWRIDDALGRSTAAVGDIDGDGRPDIVYAGRRDPETGLSLLHAVDGSGDALWASHTADDAPIAFDVAAGAPALADIDGDPGLEIALGGALFDHDGTLLWEDAWRSALLGSPHDMSESANILYPGSLATFVDLTGDGHPELLTGRDAWSITTSDDDSTTRVEPLWTVQTGGDGYPAVADLDADGTPEVVLVAWPDILVLDGATGDLWCGVDPSGTACAEDSGLRTQPLPIPGSNLGGPPTIADFDGDGRPEVALEVGDALLVLDLHRDGETLVFPEGAAEPPLGAIFPRWSTPIQDSSSASNGVGAFDFDGDGAVDLAFQDECYLRLLDGPTGEVLQQVEHTSLTVHEYPVVVDLDGDGYTELVVATNLSDAAPLAGCAASIGEPDFPQSQGIYVYTDAAWAPALSTWTSHTGNRDAHTASFRANTTP